VTTDLYSACQPRQDVLAGELSESIFAASLDEVISGTAPAAYGEPDGFFAATHPSHGLRELLLQSLGRVTGARPAAPPIIRLETNLGGGKTHNLIALWHAARGGLPGLHKTAFVADSDVVPDEPVAALAAFVGTSAGADSFPAVDDVSAPNLWEYLARQLGGEQGVALVRGHTAPGAAKLKELLGDRPTLILVDELARYLATAAGHAVGDSNLARQTVSFLMALMEAVDAKERASLVLTSTEITDAFGDQTEAVLAAIAEAGDLMARREHVLRPSGEADLPRILARRLFERVDDAAAAETGRAYGAAAEDDFRRGADLPADLQRGTWVEAVAATYPFHPRLVEVLDKRLSTIPNFQRTRGALRLLATVVRRLWDERPPGTRLIHTHHVDLADLTIAEELSSRLGRPKFENVIRSDVASGSKASPAHAEEVDARLGIPYAGRLARTVYLYSLTEGTPGVSAPELLAATLSPGDDHNVCTRALDSLESSCWYLHVDDRGYRFSTEASLVKLILDAQGRIPLSKVRAEATDILARQFRDAALRVRRSWEDARVPDREDEAALVLLHWDQFGDDHGVDPRAGAPDRVREIWEHTPSGGLRQFRNRLVFLTPSTGTHDAMLDAVRRHLALRALALDPDRLQDLSEERRTELKGLASESEMLARIAVCNHVNVLFVPRGDGLEPVELSTVTQASVLANQTEAVLDRLRAMDKTLASGDQPVDPGLVRSRLGAQLDQPMPTADLARAFARRGDMKLVLDRAQLVTLVRNGVTNRVWEYQDTTLGAQGWATADRPPGAVRIGEETLLHPVGSAPSPAPVTCPLCGTVHTGACPNDASAEGGTTGGALAPTAPFEGSGAAPAAVTTAAQAAVEAGASRLTRVEVSISEVGTGLHQQLARLHSLVPAGQPGATVVHDIEVRAALDQPGHGVHISYRGPAEGFAALKSACDHVLRSGDATLTARVDATFDPPMDLDGDAWSSFTQRASDTGPARCDIRLHPADPS
jgi:hypothetical protein